MTEVNVTQDERKRGLGSPRMAFQRQTGCAAKAEAQLRGRSTPAGPIRADLGDHASALAAGSDETDTGAIGRREAGQGGSGRKPVCRRKPEKRGCTLYAGNLPNIF